MANTCRIVRQPCVLRLARLAADGTTPAGATNGYIADGLIEGTVTPSYSDTAEIFVTDACDRVCVNEPSTPILRGVDVSLTFCAWDPERTELLAAATLLTAGADSIGWALPAAGALDTPGVSLEVFLRSYIAGLTPTTLPFVRLVIPRLTRVRFAERALSRDKMAETFTGVGLENGGWGNGPANDVVVAPTSRAMFMFADAGPLPVGACGYTATPPQV